ncbi:hypothetical protein Nepgr_033200 [Nepenthes gracilis]|uniref:Uncharacterized protein n=1 Tax=Nepenthes gracilis TaxID=150966 RepID=A0AAD3TKZ6_NEPGR|nr:hypothetical protein Nepgr_033200 [Nepenthes gracilis]
MKRQVIRLSAATQDLPRSVICNVHGVNPKFLVIGRKMKEELANGNREYKKGTYYIGKMVWNKGYKEQLKLLSDHKKELAGLKVDLLWKWERLRGSQGSHHKIRFGYKSSP